MAGVCKCVLGTHIVAWRSRLRLPIDMGEVLSRISVLSIAQHGLLAGRV
jgi:hypothetical protein